MDKIQEMRKGMSQGSLQVFGLSNSKNRVAVNLDGIVFRGNNLRGHWELVFRHVKFKIIQSHPIDDNN